MISRKHLNLLVGICFATVAVAKAQTKSPVASASPVATPTTYPSSDYEQDIASFDTLLKQPVPAVPDYIPIDIDSTMQQIGGTPDCGDGSTSLVSLLQSGIDDAVEKIAEIDKLAKESVALCNLSITFVIPTLRKNLRNSNLSADLKASLSLKLDTSASKFTSALSKFQASLDSLSVANQKVDAAKKALAALGQLLSACPVDQDAVKAALSEFNKVMADLNAAIKQANVDIVAGDLDAEVGVKLQEDVDSEIPK